MVGADVRREAADETGELAELYDLDALGSAVRDHEGVAGKERAALRSRRYEGALIWARCVARSLEERPALKESYSASSVDRLTAPVVTILDLYLDSI